MDKFVLHVPKWQGQMIFSKEILVFLGVILLTIVGTLFCFWGYKYFRTILFLGIRTVVCYLSYLLVEPMTANLAARMFLTVSLTLFGLVLLYFLDIIFVYFLDKLRIRNALGKHVYLLAAPLGAVILGLTVYHFIWRDAVTAVVLSAVCLTGGLVFQYFNRKKVVRFKCYNDLLKMPLPKFETGETGAAVEAVAPMSELEPEAGLEILPEPEPEAESETLPEAEEAAEPVALMSELEPEAGLEILPEPEPEPETLPEAEEAAEAVAPMSELEPEAGLEILPEPEPAIVAVAEMDLSPAAVMEEETPVPEPEPTIVPVAEMHLKPVAMMDKVPEKESGGIRYLIFRKLEQEDELIEDALFVRKMKEDVMAEKQSGQLDTGLAALAAARYTQVAGEAVEKYKKPENTVAVAAQGTDTKRRRAKKKPEAGKRISGKEYARRERRFVHGVTVAIAGIGIFLAGRASKRKD